VKRSTWLVAAPIIEKRPSSVRSGASRRVGIQQAAATAIIMPLKELAVDYRKNKKEINRTQASASLGPRNDIKETRPIIS
jgi:hypothetical protein